MDTLKELYEGNEALFRGLSVDDGWDWSKRHPVVRLDFSSGDFFDPDELHDNLTEQFDALESEYAAESGYDRAPIRFRSLLRELHRRTGRRVVVLVDEYDKPILDAIDDPEIATLNRRRLRALYGTIKFADAHVELTFITGVSKYSKVSLFSDLNNLIDLTLDPAYAAICGYTEADLDAVFVRNCRAWTGTRSAPGTTATIGWARNGCTIHSACSCCSAAACSRRTGSRRRRRGS